MHLQVEPQELEEGGLGEIVPRRLRRTHLPTAWSWVSGLRNCERINSCGLSPLVGGLLLWRIQQTDIHPVLPKDRAMTMSTRDPQMRGLPIRWASAHS